MARPVVFYLLCCLPICSIFAQSLPIDSLTSQGVLLEKGWTFQVGDNPDWAKPGFDDRNWETILPTNDIRAIPQLWKTERGWFRLRFSVDILGDLTQNLQKITQHGSRATSIIKGMLAHSRASTGDVEPTDLNALADEYLRLAYQGLKAKDKEFTCELVTQFNSTLGSVELVPQEMGRVLLNLFNNAFYAVRERQKQAGSDYQSMVTVSTVKTETGIEIRVWDNGMGMPASVQQKIFQPFFTTKPTGEGTGLGLSLSYDIVTKGHGGSLVVESQEGTGAEFIIQLPAAKKQVTS
ncbi:hypothetical protein BH09BAC4_BH09BAC4_52020 [soil metagenome]